METNRYNYSLFPEDNQPLSFDLPLNTTTNQSSGLSETLPQDPINLFGNYEDYGSSSNNLFGNYENYGTTSVSSEAHTLPSIGYPQEEQGAYGYTYQNHSYEDNQQTVENFLEPFGEENNGLLYNNFSYVQNNSNQFEASQLHLNFYSNNNVDTMTNSFDNLQTENFTSLDDIQPTIQSLDNPNQACIFNN